MREREQGPPEPRGLVEDPSIDDPFDLLDDTTNEELSGLLEDLSRQRRTRNRNLP